MEKFNFSSICEKLSEKKLHESKFSHGTEWK